MLPFSFAIVEPAFTLPVLTSWLNKSLAVVIDVKTSSFFTPASKTAPLRTSIPAALISISPRESTLPSIVTVPVPFEFSRFERSCKSLGLYEPKNLS